MEDNQNNQEEGQNAPYCCSLPAKWVVHSVNLKYWYCTVCKKEAVHKTAGEINVKHIRIGTQLLFPAPPSTQQAQALPTAALSSYLINIPDIRRHIEETSVVRLSMGLPATTCYISLRNMLTNFGSNGTTYINGPTSKILVVDMSYWLDQTQFLASPSPELYSWWENSTAAAPPTSKRSISLDPSMNMVGNLTTQMKNLQANRDKADEVYISPNNMHWLCTELGRSRSHVAITVYLGSHPAYAVNVYSAAVPDDVCCWQL